MADYRDRLRLSIQFTSPSGNVFDCKWRGDTHSQSKKIGMFNFPGVDGTIIQDLGVSSMTYPLTVFFDGADHDLASRAFMAAFRERGAWIVNHPIYGKLSLQPLSFTPATQPITSSGITQIDTEWIEPLDDEEEQLTAAELLAAIGTQKEQANQTGADQLNNTTFQKITSEIAEVKNAVLDIVKRVEQHIESLSESVAEYSAEIEAIKRDIDYVLGVVPLDMIALAGQIQALIQLPGQAITDTQTRLDAYLNFASSLYEISPTTTGTGSYNRASVQECALTATLAAVVDVSSTGSILSRPEAIGVIETNLALFRAIIDTLDVNQELFLNQPLDKQYFSQSQSYTDSMRLVALTVAYLLKASFALRTEKRFTLERAKNPVLITIEEYGSLGDGESNLDLFLDSNKIQDKEHIIVPKGRELVVYV